jgi:hypothetical protein
VPDACDPCPLDNPDDVDGDGVCDSDQATPPTDGTTDGGSNSGSSGDKESGGCNTASVLPAAVSWWLPLMIVATVLRRRP